MPKLCLSRPGGTTFATSCRACCRCLASRAKLLTYWNEFHLSRLWITFEFPQREGVTQVTSSMKLYGVTWVSWEEITESLLQEGGFDISVSKLRENSSLNQCWRCLMEREAGLMQGIWKSGPWCRWRIPQESAANKTAAESSKGSVLTLAGAKGVQAGLTTQTLMLLDQYLIHAKSFSSLDKHISAAE